MVEILKKITMSEHDNSIIMGTFGESFGDSLFSMRFLDEDDESTNYFTDLSRDNIIELIQGLNEVIYGKIEILKDLDDCKFTLYYADLKQSKESLDIEKKEFEDSDECYFYSESKFIENDRNNIKVVYLLSVKDEVYITDNFIPALDFLFCSDISNFNCENKIDVFIQEYESYEDAYKAALGMKETNELCYNNK